MEQARYLMWAKRKTIDCSNRYVGDSWEEQAFAEDAAGSLGCVWPPRSYSCSFCRREFRSAQALGGHMNVHRRDRARLKQQIHPIINPHDESAQNHHHATIDPCSGTLSFDAPFIHNNPISHDFLVSNPKSVIRESSPPPINVINSEENTTSTLSFFSPNVQKTLLNNIAPLHPQSWSSFVTAKKDCTTLRQIENWRNPTNKKTVYSADEKKDCLSEKLNLVVSQTQTISSSDVEEVPSRKRRRMEADPLGTFFTKLSEVDHHSCNLQQSTHEELDLELRLGDAPKVKQKRDI